MKALEMPPVGHEDGLIPALRLLQQASLMERKGFLEGLTHIWLNHGGATRY